ncbi:hypothetical protein CJ186_08770 [Actinomyces graevenitzii]|jgi:lipoprotein|uniref:DUF6318 family protein n=1 Tax=Actinomyces graevenitzii TaxID=55565 RepID=UPI000C80D470|nr:DUF6318 family protein [Actinomyces graevenitzii]PMC90948.1 hypothetical protein CJ186_08770 [Actinomyces graevenitzii]
MKTPPTKRSLQAALALTLLACSGLSGCSGSQEQNGSNAGNSKAAVATARAKTPSVTPTASGKAKDDDKPTVSPTATLSPELEAARKQARNTQPPPKPELITVNNDDGAIATAKYWVQLNYYIYVSGRTNEYKELCPGNTYIATKPVEKAQEIHNKGSWSSPVTITFTNAFRRSDYKDAILVQVNFDHEAFTQYNKDGNSEYINKQSRWSIVRLEYNGSQWTVIEASNHEK